jgi:hypothetical protein
MTAHLRSILLCICSAAVGLSGLHAQTPAPEATRVAATVVKGDTLPVVNLRHVDVEGRYAPVTRKHVRRYDRLTRNVQKVYPYARIAADLLDQYEAELQMMAPKDRSLYMKLAEAELRTEFETELRDLSMSQGRLLLKLVDRETGRTSYDLVKDMRGSFQAFLWQGLARLFGQDLRSTYDPWGEDNLTEVVVRRIERGELQPEARKPRTQKAEARLLKRKARLYRRYGVGRDDVSQLVFPPGD